ncbi:MAG: hypothetical protein NC311_05145 [Muribaculaceae bacterium]|nr:hypothetical protein [Muribaculaceae bacterium]
MFDDVIVVKSAVSAFNNAALIAPAFLWHAILAMPLFVLVYFCGNVFLDKIGWNRNNIINNSSVTMVVMTFIWLVLFGGNYVVLRDGVSVLPFVSAVILGLCGMFVAARTRDVKLPRWKDASRRMRMAMIGAMVLILLAVGVTDLHAWWGPILQIGAVVFGVVVGRRGRRTLPVVSGAIVIMTMVVVAVLMQPEYFRFGQLGNLSVLHMLAIFVFGALVAACVAINNVKPCSRIHRSAYIKLKWMARFIVALGLVLFFMTESVPVFLGTVVAMFVSFAMSVWHAKKVSENLGSCLFALTLGAFGVLTAMPVITALGILCWMQLPCASFVSDIRELL